MNKIVTVFRAQIDNLFNQISIWTMTPKVQTDCLWIGLTFGLILHDIYDHGHRTRPDSKTL